MSSMDPEHTGSSDPRVDRNGSFKSEPSKDTLELGVFRITPIDAGSFRLDGGAMFGVVPKTLWSRVIESDALNRIPMAMRCMLVESAATGRVYLVDTGAGTKFDRKMTSIYDLSYGGDATNSTTDPLLSSLAGIGLQPEDITDVIFTHLHFDHCGGAVKRTEAGGAIDSKSPTATIKQATSGFELTFPNAAHHVSKRQWETANTPNAREKASFLKENIEPLRLAVESGVLLLEEDHVQFEHGFDTLPANGHSNGQWLPRLKGTLHTKMTARVSSNTESRLQDETTLLYAADLIPTQHHVPLPWVMGYDMRPVVTLEEKQSLLTQAAKEQWMFFLEHDPKDSMILIREDEKGRFSAIPISTA